MKPITTNDIATKHLTSLSKHKELKKESWNCFYYIPTNVISLDTVDFTECDPMLRITTLWFSESVSPLSETDDVVHNVFLNTQCMRYCDVFHIAPYTIFTKYFLCFKMKPTNPTRKHKQILLMHLD